MLQLYFSLVGAVVSTPMRHQFILAVTLVVGRLQNDNLGTCCYSPDAFLLLFALSLAERNGEQKAGLRAGIQLAEGFPVAVNRRVRLR